MNFGLNDLFDDFPSIVYIKDSLGKYKYANKAFETFLGQTKDNIIGKDDFELFDEEKAKKHRLHDELVIKSGESKLSPSRFYTKPNGEVCWMKATKKLISLDDGTKGILGITTDVTEQQKKEKKLLQAQNFEATIHRITSGLFDLNDENELITKFVSETFKELGLKDLVVYLKRENRDELEQAVIRNKLMVESTDELERTSIYSFNDGIIGRAAKTKQVQLIKNTKLDSDYVPDIFEGRSELAVPIVVDDVLIGVLDSEHEQENYYTDFHIEVFKTASKLLGLKIVQLRDYNRYKKTQNYLNRILESPENLVVFSLDRKYRYQTFNTQHKAIMKKIWGVDIEIGNSILDYILNDEDKAKARENFDKALSGQEFTLIEEYGSENFKRSYWEDFYAPHKNEDGEIAGVNVFVRDVSTELKYQKALEESQSLLTSITANIQDGICRKSIEKGFIYTNQGMSKLFGYAQNEFKSIQITDIMNHPREGEQIIKNLIQGVSFSNKEIEWKRKDGTVFWGLLNCQGYTKDNDFIIDSSIVDISDLKKAREELQENFSKLEKLNTELDHLVYRTSHDLRTPVASLLGLLEMLRLDDEPDPKYYMGIFTSQLKRLDNIIKDIINYRKIAKMGGSVESVDLELLFFEVLKDNEFTEGSGQIEKNVKVAEECRTDVVLEVFSLNILLNNLISNAIKYADIDKETPFVNIEAKIDGDDVVITVEDNGIGIPKDQQPKVFDMFHRATNKKTGTGLGLFILKEAVDKMGGKVSFESDEGIGTTFIVRLPNKA